MSKEQLIGFFEKITGGVRQHDALPSNLFFVYLMREEEMFTAERREFFLKELVRWNILSLEAKGAFNEIIKLRNEHIHGRFEKIIARYCNDSRKLDQYFGDLISKRKDEMVELHPFKLEWNPLSYSENANRKVSSAYSILTLWCRGPDSEPQSLNSLAGYNGERRVCVSLAEGAKNLVEVESRTEKETGMRKGEANCLLWADIDMERRTITLNHPEKGGNALQSKQQTHRNA